MSDPVDAARPSSTRVNAPYPQPGPVAIGLIAIGGAGLAIRGLVTLRPGSEPWWVGIVAMGVFIAGFAVLEGGWLWIQREVAVSDEAIVVRRWSEVLRSKPGRTIRLDGSVSVRTTLRNVRSVRIERDSRLEVVFTLGYWDQRRVQDLLVAFAAHGVVVSRHPDDVYPPGP